MKKSRFVGGVSYHARSRKYLAYARHKGHQFSLGYFKLKRDAVNRLNNVLALLNCE